MKDHLSNRLPRRPQKTFLIVIKFFLEFSLSMFPDSADSVIPPSVLSSYEFINSNSTRIREYHIRRYASIHGSFRICTTGTFSRHAMFTMLHLTQKLLSIGCWRNFYSIRKLPNKNGKHILKIFPLPPLHFRLLSNSIAA